MHMELVQELIEEEILPRTEAKSLLRFRCVSKSWRSLIDGKPFIDRHLLHHYSTGLNYFIYCHRCGPHSSPLCSDWPSSYPTTLTAGDGRWSIVGHHNGLICLLNLSESGGRLFLFNPCTRVSVELPDPELVFENHKSGFGWHEHSGAYKVFVSVQDRDFYHEGDDDGDEGDYDGRIARIYSSETNSWKEVEHGSYPVVVRFGTFVRGKIYWLTQSGHIEYLDLRNEVFGKTMIDQPPSRYKFGQDGVWAWLLERTGSLYFVSEKRLEGSDASDASVWVMKKENVWVEDHGLASELHMDIHHVHRAFPYVKTLVSPPLSLLEKK